MAEPERCEFCDRYLLPLSPAPRCSSCERAYQAGGLKALDDVLIMLGGAAMAHQQEMSRRFALGEGNQDAGGPPTHAFYAEEYARQRAKELVRVTKRLKSRWAAGVSDGS